MVEIPDSLVERLKARQVVLVAGLGCSELAGAPGWKAFTASLAQSPVFADARAQVAGLVAAGRLGDALALVRDLQPPAMIEDAIRQAFPENKPLPDSMTLAAEYPWRAVVTTAFDDLWERALAPAGGRPDRPRVLVGTDVSARARLGGSDVPLLHLFGRPSVPGSLCIGSADARQRLVPSAGLAWLDQLRRRRSLVLIGFRPSDPDLVWLASWLAAQPAKAGSGPHYLFLDLSDEADPDAEAAVWELRTGIEILPCLDGTGGAGAVGEAVGVDPEAAAARRFRDRSGGLARSLGAPPGRSGAPADAGARRGRAAGRRALGRSGRAPAPAAGSAGRPAPADRGAGRGRADLPRAPGRTGAGDDRRDRHVAPAADRRRSLGEPARRRARLRRLERA